MKNKIIEIASTPNPTIQKIGIARLKPKMIKVAEIARSNKNLARKSTKLKAAMNSSGTSSKLIK